MPMVRQGIIPTVNPGFRVKANGASGDNPNGKSGLQSECQRCIRACFPAVQVNGRLSIRNATDLCSADETSTVKC